MKKSLIAVVSSIALLMAGVSFAAEAPKGDAAKPQQEMKKDTAKPKEAKKETKKKCAEGQVYSKQDKKCVAKAASAAPAKPAPAAAPAAPASAPAK